MSNIINFKAKLPLLKSIKSQQDLKPLTIQRSTPHIKPSSHVPIAKTPSSEYYCPLPKNLSSKQRVLTRGSVEDRPSVYLPPSFTKNTLQNLSFLNEQSKNSIRVHDNTEMTPSNLLNSTHSKFNRFSSQNLERITKKDRIRSEAGISNVTSPVFTPIQVKRIEKWPIFDKQPDSASEKTLTDFFAANKKKYKIMRRTGNFNKGANAKDPDIELIKQSVKITGQRRSKLGLALKDDLKEMGEINLTKKSGQPLTVEDERQVKLLRKKVEISNVFNSRALREEEKKMSYRQLILEFHPDKTRHESQFAMAIFHFLQSNKERFLGVN